MVKQIKPTNKVFKKLTHYKESIDNKIKSYFADDENFSQLCAAAAMLKVAETCLKLYQAFPDQEELLFLLTPPVMLALGTAAGAIVDKVTTPNTNKTPFSHKTQVDTPSKD